MSPHRWHYDAATGALTRYAVALAGGVVTATAPAGDVRQGVARDDAEAEEWLRKWGLHATEGDAVAAAWRRLREERAEVQRRLDLAHDALEAIARRGT